MGLSPLRMVPILVEWTWLDSIIWKYCMWHPHATSTDFHNFLGELAWGHSSLLLWKNSRYADLSSEQYQKPSLRYKRWRTQVWFDFGNHFLYIKDELPQCFPDGQYDDYIELSHPERYQWLVDLVGTNLADPNFCLRKVLIEERLFNSEFTYHDSHS